MFESIYRRLPFKGSPIAEDAFTKVLDFCDRYELTSMEDFIQVSDYVLNRLKNVQSLSAVEVERALVSYKEIYLT